MNVSLSNTHTEFIGVERLITEHNAQVHSFIDWADRGDWHSFHSSHFDWWAFPIDKPSQHDYAFTVYESEIVALKTNDEFSRLHVLGSELLLLSWGWQWASSVRVPMPDPSQAWAHWPIRLYKCSRSMWLFGFEEHWQSCVNYAKYLHEKGESFWYSNRDLFNEIVSPWDY